jgi:undecaprenyl-diphosphatase
MSLMQSMLLGLVQGLTEFIPVSSTAHLILVPWLLGWEFPTEAEFVFDVLVQWGTLLAVLVYFRRDVAAILLAVIAGLRRRRPLETFEARLGWLVVAATLPAVLIGLVFKDFFEATYASPVGTAAFLLGTAALLFLSERFGRRDRGLTGLGWLDAVVIGFAQAVALLPGISRSGATIAGGLARGLDRPAAARFSFLMSMPALLGAGVLATLDLLAIPNFAAYLPPILAGFVVAAVVGYACIHWLLSYLARHSLYVFAAYCVLASLACLAIAALR